MFNLKLALLGAAREWIADAERELTAEIMAEKSKRITSGPAIEKNGDTFNIMRLHGIDIQDIYAAMKALEDIHHYSPIVETLKDFAEKLIKHREAA